MALIAGMMVSCDPITESDPGISANLTEADLQARVALTQTTAGQNKFTFSTNPTLTVQVLDQDGAILATGTEGSIIGTPPLTSLTVRAMNQDGSIVSYSQDVTINEYVDVPSIYKQLFGPEYNSRTWVWDTTDAPNYWGNGGYMSDSGPNWWKFEDIASGNTNEAFDNQCIEKGCRRIDSQIFKIRKTHGEFKRNTQQNSFGRFYNADNQRHENGVCCQVEKSARCYYANASLCEQTTRIT